MKMMYVTLTKATLCSFILLSCLFVSAQQQKTASESSNTAKFGIKGGVNFSNLYVDDISDENVKLGFNAGIFTKIPITNGLSIQPELLYSSKGSKLTYDNILLGEGEYRFNLNYAELPVLAVINIARNFNIHAGAYAGYLLKADIKKMNDEGETDDIAELDEDDFNRIDYGLVGGLGLDIQNFSIGARYNYGLKNAGKDSEIAGQALGDSKNSVISLYIGLAF